MAVKPSYRTGQNNVLITLAAFIIVIAGLKSAEALVVPILLSTFIAIVCSPLVFWLQKKKVPLSLAVILVLLLVIILVSLVGTLIGSSVKDFSNSLPIYQNKITQQIGSLQQWLSEWGIKPFDSEIMASFDPGTAMDLAARIMNSLGAVLSDTFLIMFTVIFILLEASSFPSKLQTAFNNDQNLMSSIKLFQQNMKNYIAIKSLVSLITGTLVSIWLWLLGVDYPILWGLLAFLFNFVPNIGSIIAAVPAVLLALIQVGVLEAGLAAMGYLIVNFVIGNIVEPRFMGKGMGLSTLIVFLSLVFWGWVFGPVGMLLSVPLTMTMKLALDSNENTRWLAVLMGPDITVQPEK